ncbi:hypothetical protein A3K73_00940 [Candidatus Pacearchaeota archaeon RBG_13_36_9]|nr:MAG: hypothetical protein A3K73_00940 [Candidatus Pacearchaeota archaeon RBG_13_36_9]
MIKKSLILLIAVFVLPCILAQEYKLGIDLQESFQAGDPITFKVNIFDSQNNIINGEVKVEIEDPETGTVIEKTVNSGEAASVVIDNPRAGYWSISAIYQDMPVTKEFFEIKANQEVKFDIVGDELIIRNVGNKRYSNTIDIVIGESYTQQDIELDIGEETSFRLVAPDGTYSVKVTDGKTTLSQAGVQLTGISGNVIGILDPNRGEPGPITSGPRGDQTIYGSLRNNTIVWVFILVVVGAAILLAVERGYRRRI